MRSGMRSERERRGRRAGNLMPADMRSSQQILGRSSVGGVTAHDEARLHELMRDEQESNYDPFNETDNIVRLPAPLIKSSRIFTCGFSPPDYLIDELCSGGSSIR